MFQTIACLREEADALKTSPRTRGAHGGSNEAERDVVALFVGSGRGQIADKCSDQNIGLKVALAVYARDAHSGGGAVGQHLGQPAGILVGQNASDSPSRSGMFARKRGTALEKAAVTRTFIRPRTAEGIFCGLNECQTTERRFARQKARFTPVLVVVLIAKQPHRARASHQGGQPCVGKTVVA